jgi:hypothetical protein
VEWQHRRDRAARILEEHREVEVTPRRLSEVSWFLMT